MLAVALVAAGCGGEEPPVDTAATGATATPTTDTTGAVTGDPATAGTIPEANPGATEDIPGANELSQADAASGTLVKVTAITPKRFADAHCSKPVLVVLYQPGSILDEELYKSARAGARRAAIKDLVTIAFAPRDVKAMGDLPSKLGLLSTPGIATVGRDGTIENFWTTYVDEALIQRSLENAAAATPCEVSSADVPAAGAALSDAAIVANGGTVTNTSTAPLAGSPPGTPAVDAASADPFAATGAAVSAGATAPIV